MGAARQPRHRGAKVRLWDRRLRRLHSPRGQAADALVPDPDRERGRGQDHHDRGGGRPSGRQEGANLRILDFLKRGALVELEGTPFAKAYPQEDGFIRTEIRLNVSKTNILRPAKCEDESCESDIVDREECEDPFDASLEDFTIDEDDF